MVYRKLDPTCPCKVILTYPHAAPEFAKWDVNKDGFMSKEVSLSSYPLIPVSSYPLIPIHIPFIFPSYPIHIRFILVALHCVACSYSLWTIGILGKSVRQSHRCQNGSHIFPLECSVSASQKALPKQDIPREETLRFHDMDSKTCLAMIIHLILTLSPTLRRVL